MDRRHFLATLAAGTAGLLTGCADRTTGIGVSSGTAVPPSDTPPSTTPPPRLPLAGPLPSTRVRLPAETITALPGTGRALALTIDDGASSEVVGAYCQFAKDTGARFTFFVTGQFDAWRDNRAALVPLVESGQVQLGNHSWSHPDLTSLTARGCADELTRTKRFLRNTYGVDGTPYYRPPFGYRNAQVDAVAASLGYTMPTLWDGSLSDSGLVTEKFLIGAARRYFRPQRIVIGHANDDPVTRVYDHFTTIIRQRRLQMVTLDDYFAPR
ncbi:polysaccharide deacetylase family protein [Gordonia crocea]|uniref:polysaccharide deacetylase family protein n=1 Tax=Gordonia crocea TaxID=589162 RepID=UPI001379DC76|nr:polysaccharide deacetylase family protein [Gordonia crocea]